jgi:hypothetical protein
VTMGTGENHYFTQCSQGAKVFSKLNSLASEDLLSKSQHLAAIHKAPEQYWQQLTEMLIEKEWSVKEIIIIMIILIPLGVTGDDRNTQTCYLSNNF